MVRLIIHGYNGKMGKTVAQVAQNSDKFTVSAGVDKVITNISATDFPVYKTLSDVKEQADVVIDFSFHTAVPLLLHDAVIKKIPVVVATTGLSDEEKKALQNASKDIPIFVSANMSLGVNLMIKLVKIAAKILADNYEIEIIEKHHNQKLDSPSGTALMIADAINSELNSKLNYVYGRNPQSGKRNKKDLGIHSIRGGTIVGEHDVIFAGTDEIIEIKHTAQSRAIFAYGALKAAEFIIGKQPGLYTMDDIMKDF